MTITANTIRQTFLDFFREKGHAIVPSAPMVNKDDPTLMFTNAGMNPFKDYFLGHKPPVHPRIADTQKCLRVSGKHNDLEEVGQDGYHHTMFEMLGNWSFGDYFKEEAIDWAFELLTRRYKLDTDRIYVSVFGGDAADGLPEDTEARGYWQKWMPADRILSFGKKDNFWEMGDTGPCGPCSEIHVDLRSDAERAATPGHDLVNAGHPNVIEIWNLVFIQFNRKADGSLEGLPARHVDTGMGFERLVRVIQAAASNYDTDIFTPMIRYTEQATGITYTGDYSGASKTDIAMRVLADHIRAVSFGIADGQMPSNTGAGYVLRRILRRAVRYYYTFLNVREPFIHRLIPLLADFFKDIFPDFNTQRDFVRRVIEQEEAAFLRTLEGGIRRFETLKVTGGIVAGEDAFELFDTYGFPIDLTRLMAAERGWQVDEAGFAAALQAQKARSRADANIEAGDWVEVHAASGSPVFDGYDSDELDGVRLLKYRSIKSREGHTYQLVFDRTPFYPEGGGQVGDRGVLYFADEPVLVEDTIKENDLPILIARHLPSKTDVPVTAVIDAARRRLIENNHSATHLLHAALREVLGDHVQQRGSLLNEEYLRFDFAHFGKVSDEEIARVEAIVNRRIREDIARGEDRDLPIVRAQEAGARMLFGEKYGEKVRMITFDPSFSIELCGGCHVSRTGRIGFFKIVGESAVAAGVRRIEAVTADAAERYVAEQEQLLGSIRQALKHPADPVKAILDLQQEVRTLRQELEQIERDKADAERERLVKSVREAAGIPFISEEVGITDGKLLKQLIYQVGQQMASGVVVLGARDAQKAQLMIWISEDLVRERQLHAGNLVKQLAKAIDGGGGGQPFFASAGGSRPDGLGDALAAVAAAIAG
jgi:alanyl-tRNA synthetase